MPAVRDEADEIQQAFFQSSTNVDVLARDLFSVGVDATPVDKFYYQQSVAATARCIAEVKTVIYEATIKFERLLCAVNILVKQGSNCYAYKVKSTTSVKPLFLKDVYIYFS